MEQLNQTTPTQKKKIIFSGIQPTGVFTLGNYLGALKNWGTLQDEYNCLYSIVDMHAITVAQDSKKLKEQTLASFALLLACGIDPKKAIVFIQSHVKEHAMLSWVLSCSTAFGELSRMTQFKDKSAKHSNNVNVGLFTYPVLMAADILLYQSDFVPVGADQKQHLELARDVAIRFNNSFGNTFTVPEPYIKTLGAKIMSLQEPLKKMSKSDENTNAFVSILDKPEVIVKKFKRAVTDSDACVCYKEGKDGINNLMGIYSAISGKSYDEIEAIFAGKGYGDFKTQLGELVADHLAPVRQNFDDFMKNKDYLESCYKEGAQKASAFADRTIKKVYKKVGFIL